MANSDRHDKLLSEQIDYYRARAGEYDEWFLRRGRYDRGPGLNGRWFAEVEEVRRRLRLFKPAGDMLELACGTGLWTEQLLAHANRLTAVDAVAEVLAVNQERVRSETVEYVQADLFSWRPARQYDAVFFGFWLSHVPPERFSAFWDLVASALKPEGRVFFVDSRYEPSGTAVDHRLEGEGATSVTRRLNDGNVYRIVKVFYTARDLAPRLHRLGWDIKIMETDNFFIYGYGKKTAAE